MKRKQKGAKLSQDQTSRFSTRNAAVKNTNLLQRCVRLSQC